MSQVLSWLIAAAALAFAIYERRKRTQPVFEIQVAKRADGTFGVGLSANNDTRHTISLERFAMRNPRGSLWLTTNPPREIGSEWRGKVNILPRRHLASARQFHLRDVRVSNSKYAWGLVRYRRTQSSKWLSRQKVRNIIT